MSQHQAAFLAAIIAATIIALGLTGCAPDLSKLSWIKGDTATVCATVQTPYGNVTVVRIGQTGTSVKGGGCGDLQQGASSGTTVVAVPLALGQTAQILH